MGLPVEIVSDEYCNISVVVSEFEFCPDVAHNGQLYEFSHEPFPSLVEGDLYHISSYVSEPFLLYVLDSNLLACHTIKLREF